MPANSPFTENEKNYIRVNFEAMTIRQMAERLNRSEGGVKTWVIKLGLRRNNRFDWNEEKIEILRALYPEHSAEYIAEKLNTRTHVIYKKAESLGLKKTPEYLAALNKRMGEQLMKKGFQKRFQKGQKPWCAGKKIGSHPNSAKTQFKKGERPRNALPVGALAKPAGYWKIKLAEPNVWDFLHLHLWKQTHGEIEKGICIIFKDKNPDNCVIENLEGVTRKELYKRNSVHELPEELRNTIYTLGRLKRAINRSLKNAEKQN